METDQTPQRLITPILIDIDNDVIYEKGINVDQNSRSQTAMESVWPVSKLSTESVGSRRELVANSCSHRRRRRDKTVSSRRRRRCVLGIMARAK